ncbi:MAG: hypothetical protein WD359_04485 [Dehalococcoidia bacterium]
MLKRMTDALRNGEEGHATAGIGTVIGAAGAIMLAIGAAGDTDWLTITGGIVLAIGVIAAGVLHHQVVDYDLFGRLDKLEGK